MGNLLSPPLETIPVTKDHPFILEVRKKKEEMTGWERVRFAFVRDEFGDLSPELYRVKDATMMGTVAGIVMGAMGRGRVEYMDFFRRNNITQFETPLKAKSALQDKMFLGMGSGAFRLGWRMGLFTFMYISGATVISSYRNKHGLIDQVAGAGTAGFLYKFRDGPKAAFAGGLFGSLLGLVAGALTLGLMKLVGSDFEYANIEYYHRLQKRLEAEKAILRDAREKGTHTKWNPMTDETDTTKLEVQHNLFVAGMKQQMAEEAATRRKSVETSAENKIPHNDNEQHKNSPNQSSSLNNTKSAIEEKN